MGKFEQTMKSEIARLAKKQAKAMAGNTTAEIRSLRKKVNFLLKLTNNLTKKVSVYGKRLMSTSGLPKVNEKELEKVRMSPYLMKTLRKKLGLSQRELAILVDVSLPTIQAWEADRFRPADENLARLVSLRTLGRREVKQLLTEKDPEVKTTASSKKRIK